jgi:hypothetical protein
MVRTKKPSRTRSPIVGRRETELLNELEVLKNSNTRITVLGFCKRVGYANKSALRHFPVLRRELSLYVAQFAPHQKSAAPFEIRYFEVQIERQNRLIDRLRHKVREIPELKAKITRLNSNAKEDAHENKRLRGMLSTVIALLSSSDFAKAGDLSIRLQKEVERLLENE